MTDIVYATTNPGKFAEVQKLFTGHNIDLHAPREYGVNLNVEETGNSLEENAILKAESYCNALKENVAVLGDDTGVEIDILGGEPGIKVRRWKGYSMTDEEIIQYTLERLSGVALKERTAHFRTVIAVAQQGKPTLTFEGKLHGLILTEPKSIRIPGLPFQPLFFATDYNLMLHEIHDLPIAEKLAKRIITHRERAVLAALPYLSTLQS